MPLRPPLASRSRLLGLLPLPLPRASSPLLVGPGLGPGPGVRPFAASASRPAKQMPPRPGINEDDVDGSYLKGSGPGGQKIVCMVNFWLGTLHPNRANSRLSFIRLQSQTTTPLRLGPANSCLFPEQNKLRRAADP